MYEINSLLTKQLPTTEGSRLTPKFCGNKKSLKIVCVTLTRTEKVVANLRR
jgi:hypothetical protein